MDNHGSFLCLGALLLSLLLKTGVYASIFSKEILLPVYIAGQRRS